MSTPLRLASTRRRLCVAAGLGSLAALVPIDANARPAGVVSIDPIATVYQGTGESHGSLAVNGTASCRSGRAAGVVVRVVDTRGSAGNTARLTAGRVICDGTPHAWHALVGGGTGPDQPDSWTPGPARVTASLVADDSHETVLTQITRTITLKPRPVIGAG